MKKSRKPKPQKQRDQKTRHAFGLFKIPKDCRVKDFKIEQYEDKDLCKS